MSFPDRKTEEFVKQYRKAIDRIAKLEDQVRQLSVRVLPVAPRTLSSGSSPSGSSSVSGSLNDLTDVTLGVPAAGDVFLYNATDGQYENKVMSGDATIDEDGIVTIDHVNINSIGSNTHAAIDTHIANTSNPHSVTHTQASGAVSHAHSALTGVGASDHHTKYTDADAVTALNQKLHSFAIYPGNGASISTYYGFAYILMPAADTDCYFTTSFILPSWINTTMNIKIAYFQDGSTAWSWLVYASSFTLNDDGSTNANNILNGSTSYDIAAGTADQIYIKTISINSANLVAGDIFSFYCQSDASNGANLRIIHIWLEDA